MEIIPAIDIIDGKCVRLTQGDYNQKKEYSNDPLHVAKQYEDAGIKRLHLVDLDGARQKEVINQRVLESIATHTGLFIDFGGGIQSDHDIELAFDCGAQQVTGGSVAIKNPGLFEKWLAQYGPEKIILGADAKNKMIAVSGWQEQTETPIDQFLDVYIKKGIKYAICTDVAKDGLLQGPSVELYKEIQKQFPGLKLIASGGVSGVEDLEILAEMQVYGVIIGKAIYENRISLEDLKRFL
jgi:phosphoribosylformimino-5-aminoimidazole carboxamide ribotide isomerase